MRIVISNQSGKPIYEQIEDQIKTAILSGQLKVNEQLPSIRSLAKDLRISVIITNSKQPDSLRMCKAKAPMFWVKTVHL